MSPEQYTTDFVPIAECSCAKCVEARFYRAGGRWVRWILRRDLKQVLEIEQLGFPEPWPLAEFLAAMKCAHTLGYVATSGRQESVDGFVIYEAHARCLRIVNLAVHPSCWRRGVASTLIGKLKAKLSPRKGRRRELRAVVVESNLEAQKFFKSQGFRCEAIHDAVFDGGQSGYEFSFEVE